LQFLDKSFALHPNSLLGATDFARDHFVRLSKGKAPQQLFFARAQYHVATVRQIGWRSGLSVRLGVQIHTHS